MKSTTLTNILLAMIVVFMVESKLPLSRNSTDAEYSRLNHTKLSVVRDYATSCLYLVHENGGITPRLQMDGKQVCADDENHADVIRKYNKGISVFEEVFMVLADKRISYKQ